MLSVTKPGDEVDVGMVARHAAEVEVERPSASQPASDCRLVEQARDLADQVELDLVGAHRCQYPGLRRPLAQADLDDGPGRGPCFGGP